MKKRFGLVLGIFMLILLCIPSTRAFAAGYAEDLDSGTSVNELSTYVINTGSDAEFNKIKTYKVYVPGDTKEVILPITFDQKGLFICSAQLSEEYESVYGDFKIYADEACTSEIRYDSYNSEAKILKKGTYYLKFSVNDYASDTAPDSYIFAFASQFLNGTDRILKDKAWVCSGNTDTQKPIYYKLTVPKTGSITVNVESQYSSYVTLLSSSKKALSDKTYSSLANSNVCFAVNKGTYYLKVESSAELFRVKYTFKAISDGSGTSKAKAKKLTAGKSLAGIVTATDKTGKVDWYKVTLTKSQAVKITFTGSVSSGKIKLDFYGGGISGSITETLDTVDEDASFAAETLTSTKLPKGTYYIKITKGTKNTSGFYNIKLNK
ncbi:PPC domain-containing protein [Anaerocolumna sp. MB42-C2]|uniref:PPC domain-containing protein n=1 Tax=Anaerocolumna sp. MB42-C2 TaxID=3070997 RepID=UPI0027DF58F5|nr:PPC domain-containing protein [Anaerocolumna sp. MB42-C2]WMJ86687.1 PPC domain-containing protein [Anaerocolumna sp. MB42-C2]